MAFPEPKNLFAALTPIFYFNCLVGLGVFRPPQSKSLYMLMIMYTVLFWAFYTPTLWIGIRAMIPSYFYDDAPMAKVMYQALVYTNNAVAILTPILARFRHRGLVGFVEQLQKLDDTFVNVFGNDKIYRNVLRYQTYHIMCIVFIMLTLTIIDSIWLKKAIPFFTNLAIIVTLHYPILLMLVVDCMFCDATRCLKNKFRELNTALLGLSESDVTLYPKGRLIIVEKKVTQIPDTHEIGNSEAKNSINKHTLFLTIRKTHLELSKLTAHLNFIFGLQNLISLAVSSVMITGLLYTIYSAFYYVQTVGERIKEVTPPTCWCIIYVFKILLITYFCSTTSSEAQRSGQIIYEVLGSTIDKEFQKEIQEFALQMIQNPVRFTACGFFTIDYTYVQGVIGSITTYLVILIQMSSTPTPSPTPSANVTKT